MRSSAMIRRIFSSVFTKLLVIILFTGICINILVGGVFLAHRKAAADTFHRSLVSYINYLVSDLGSPPSLERARAIGLQTGFIIRYQGTDGRWSTSDQPSFADNEHLRIWHESDAIRAGSLRGRHVIFGDRANGQLLFEIARNPAVDEKLHRLALFLFILMALILGAVYGAVRWIFRPIRWLDKAVREVGKGRLAWRVPEKGSQEFRDLSATFNSMTDRIGGMLKAKEQLLLDVSHELRSPLTRLKVALAMMPDDKSSRSMREDVIELENMVTEILETARLHKTHSLLHCRPTDLNELIEKVMREFSDEPPGLILKPQPVPIVLDIDPDRVKTVFRNVLTNALKFSKKSDRAVEMSVQQEERSVVVVIRDYGIGVPESALPLIFEPFYRADESRSRLTGGYGLGLSLCKTIMEAHRGHISIESSVGAGAVVKLSFPIQE